MDTKIYLKDFGYLDISSEFPITTTFSLAEIKDITKRNSAFSKTIVLPCTHNNNEILGNIFEINLNYNDADFQVNRKVEATIFQNELPILKGWFKLLAVNKISPSDISFDENIEYEALVYSTQTGLFDVIKDLDITDIDLEEYNHTLNVTNVMGSSNNTYLDGYKYFHHYTSDEIYYVNDFRPAIFVKVIWDKIFHNAGYTYTSTFLNSDPFSKLLIPSNVKELLRTDEEKLAREMRVSYSTGTTGDGIITFEAPSGLYQIGDSDDWITNNMGVDQLVGQRICSAGNLTQFINNTIGTSNKYDGGFFDSSSTLPIIFNDDTTGINFDGSLDNYNTSSYIYTANAAGQYELKINLGGTMSITPVNAGTSNSTQILYTGDSIFDFQYQQSLSPDSIPPSLFFKVNVFKTNTSGVETLVASPSRVFQYPLVDIDTRVGFNSGTTTTTFLFNPDAIVINCNYQDTIRLELLILSNEFVLYKSDVDRSLVESYVEVYYDAVINTYNENNTYWSMTSIGNVVTSGDEIRLNDVLPKKIKQSEFIKSFIAMFNLYIEPDDDNDKNMIINPRDRFYNNYADEFIDWTNKIDYSNDINIKLLSETQNKTIDFKYKESKDNVNQSYKENSGFEYGEFKLNFDNDFLIGTQKIELIFEPTPIVKTLQSIGNGHFSVGEPFLVPYIIYGTESTLKILYDGGNISVMQYGIIENNISYPFYHYNFAGHFDNPTNPTLDLNWNVNEYYFYNEVVDNVTTNNLYNTYWSDYIRLISESKLMTAYFYLNEMDIVNLNFAKKIWIRDSYWYLNKIIDYNGQENTLTKVELIKAIDVTVFKPKLVSFSTQLSTTQTHFPWGGFGGDNNNNLVLPNNNNYGEATSVKGRNNIVQYGTRKSSVNGNNNIIDGKSLGVNIFGDDNYVGSSNENIFIQGNDNTIGNMCENISLNNCNNVVVLDSINNLSLTNVSNKIIGEGNITFNSDYNYYNQGILVNNSDMVDGGLNDVFIIAGSYNDNVIDQGLDTAYSTGIEGADLVNGIFNGITYNNDENIYR